MKIGHYLLFFCLVGCQTPRPIYFPTTLYLDESLSPRQKLSVVEASETWEKATDDIVRINIILGNPPGTPVNSYIVFGFNSEDPTVSKLDEEGVLLGYMGHFRNPHTAYTTQGIFLVSDHLNKSMLPERAIRWTVLHELGHLIGLGHQDQDDDSIMVPVFHTYYTPCVTLLDLKHFCNVYNCDGRKVKEACVEIPKESKMK